jgi:AsmA protein
VKRGLKIVGAVVLIFLAVLAAIPLFVNANQFRPLLESRLSAMLGREVRIGSLSLSMFSGKVSANEVTIAEDPAFGPGPFARANRLDIGVEMGPLILDRKLNVTAVEIVEPEVTLALGPDGKWNISTLGAKAAPAPAAQQIPAESKMPGFEVRSVAIAKGRFTLKRSGSPPQVIDNIDIDLKNLTPDAPFDFTLTAQRPEGGSIRLEGKAGPLSSGALHPPAEAAFRIPKLDLQKAGLVDRSSGISAVANLTGNVNWRNNQIQLNGRLAAEQVKLAKGGLPAARPVNVDFGIAHDVTNRRGRLQDATLHVGSAVAKLAGSYDLNGKEPSFALKFAADKMAVPELAAMLPALDIQLPNGSSLEGGTLSADFTMAGTLDRFSASGPISIDNTRLANYDLGSKLKTAGALLGIETSPNTEIQTLRATVKHTPEGTAFEGIQLTVPTIGEITGVGAISPANELRFNLLALVHTRGAVVAALGQKGDTRVPFVITGTASNPVVKPDVNAIANQKIQQALKDPNKTIDAAKGILEMFRKKPAPDQTPQQ